ncbi:serine protease, S1-C subfamily, contains C-terminal PDZ domain [Prosthecobacter debontii]|uniref:Serine protease, S1-C subfamily, contains C-terminal PDZ domain n=1 Tax=Prosthecobacter debontii TaxID=48467 RepID=A0A1T4XRH2_9BACT|nr:trypsin-like peptidase domain-containing protein [Prosthecobacter debontii]SKA91681.1 serine protease, S1-C subfamily, contains C-terminal PDZ domain [Prosthecobacter debontii]
MRNAFLSSLLGVMIHLPFQALQAEAPAGIQPFLELQEKVQSLLPKVRPAVVAIFTGDGTASGVIMSEDGLILTAAHVAERPGRELRVILEDGTVVRATTLGLDKTTDAALMQINDTEKKWPFVKVSRDVLKAQPGEWCFALGHPGGFDEKRGVVLRVGRIIKQTANSLQTDCVLMGGDSGGPLFDLNGDVIGIHSLIWEGRNENMHVSMAPFLRSWDEMKGSLVIRTWGIGSGGYLGVGTEANAQGSIEVVDVIAGSPSEKAGILNGDVILALNGETITGLPQFTHAVRMRAAGEEIHLKLRSKGVERDVSVTLGSRPKDEG